jgi:subtilisin family serine protease
VSPVRIAIVDSGVHANHPHVNGVAGGVSITPDGSEEADYLDRLGHGTAVTAVIREKVPDAELYAVKVFHDSLATRIESLLHALDWSSRNRMELINLSLGTGNPQHESVLRAAVDRLVGQGIRLVAAYQDGGVRWLPGILSGVVPVVLDWDCPRDEYRTSELADGRILYHASGFPRSIPGVAPERNLKGISFAVANVTGLLARDLRENPTLG